MWILAFASAVISPVIAATSGPANVLVVVNDDSPASRSIAEYYVSRRAIPKQNVCHIRVKETESISRDDYNRLIASPMGKCLKSGNLVESILYIVTTLGTPLRVSGSYSMNGTYAAVDSELTLLYSELHNVTHSLEGPLTNPFHRQREATFRHPQFPIYLVTRLAAYDVAQVKALIDRSIGPKNAGKFVIDLRSSVEEPGGDEWLRNAAILLPADRVLLEESEKVLYGAKQVIGYASWGSNDSARKERRLRFEWLPGAIATEYVSTSGRTFAKPPETWNLGTWRDQKSWFSGSPQSLTADLIADGATGAAGHVDEPYLQFTPRPDYLLPAYFSGRNLAESYYLSIPALSWQNIVIGDPLCTLK